MAKKIWYTITLVNKIDNTREEIMRVKSKGLVYHTRKMLLELYKKDYYEIEVK